MAGTPLEQFRDRLPRRPEGEARLVGMRAAIVDDDPLLLALLTRVLSREGVIVHSYSYPTEMLRDLCAEKIKPDVILTDFGMPEISGVELIRRARTMQYDGPIVVLSGWDKDDLETQVAKETSVYIFQKPFSPTEVIGLLGNLFSGPHEVQTESPQKG